MGLRKARDAVAAQGKKMLEVNDNLHCSKYDENMTVFFKKFPHFYVLYKDHQESFRNIFFNDRKSNDVIPLTHSEWTSLFNCNDIFFDCKPVLLNLHDALKYIFDSSVYVQIINYKEIDSAAKNISKHIKRIIITDKELYNNVKRYRIQPLFDVSTFEFYNKNSIGDSVISCKVGDIVKFKDSNGIRSDDMGMVTNVDESKMIIVFKNGFKLNVYKNDIISISKLIKI